MGRALTGLMLFVLTVNGREHAVDVAPGATLLEVLRDELGLTGAKLGCGEGRCGACQVLLDGRAVPACRTPIEAAADRVVVTSEGLGDGVLTAVQAAFLAEGALQCGFCTSGMVIAATALLARTPDPSDAEIRAALADHLCRCGVYGRVVRAVRRAAETPR